MKVAGRWHPSLPAWQADSAWLSPNLPVGARAVPTVPAYPGHESRDRLISKSGGKYLIIICKYSDYLKVETMAIIRQLFDKYSIIICDYLIQLGDGYFMIIRNLH